MGFGTGTAEFEMTTGHVESLQSDVEVIAATLDQRFVLANLFELYAHDFSDFHDVDVGEEGRFGYPQLALYWSDASRLPFLVRVKGKLAGFVLVKRGSELSDDPAIWDIAEFFILRRYRGRGIGSEVAHQVWRRVPGRWEIRVMESNQAGCEFWQRAIAGFAGAPVSSRPYEKGGVAWRTFSFES
jgi:predicted acetyltransferase